MTQQLVHCPQGKYGLDIARHRYDWDREEAPSALAGDATQSCYTTLYQLAFGALLLHELTGTPWQQGCCLAVRRAACARQPAWTSKRACAGEARELRTQELLWSGHKAVDYRVPRQTEHRLRMEARQAAWQAEAARSPWCARLALRRSSLAPAAQLPTTASLQGPELSMWTLILCSALPWLTKATGGMQGHHSA